MRAAILTARRAPLAIKDVVMPACPRDGVVLRVPACGICRSDWDGRVGEHARVRPGGRLGHDDCGEAVAAGPGSRWRPGDRAIAPFILACGPCPARQSGEQTTGPDQIVPGFTAPGAFAGCIAVPRDHNLARLPESPAPVLAAGLGCRVTTALAALTGRAAMRAGEWLAVHGSGGGGLSALIPGRVDVAPLVARTVALSDVSAGPAALDGPAAPGVAVVNDLLH